MTTATPSFTGMELHDMAGTIGVSSSQGDADYPFYFPANSSWFKKEINPTVPQPSYANECPGNGNNNQLHDTLQPLDERIALDSIFALDYEDEIKYMAASDLQYKLRLNESLINSDTIYSDFFDAYENSVADELCLVKLAEKSLYDTGLQTRSQLFAADSTIGALLEQESLLDSLLTTCINATDSAQVLANMEIVQNQLQVAKQECNTLIAYWYELLDNDVDDVLNQNNNISTSATTDQNTKDVSDIQLGKIFFGNGIFSSSQQTLLSSIASECPYKGGRAVLRAWALVKSRGDSTWYDAELLCDTSGNPRIENAKDEEISIKVSPNPASQFCIFSFSKSTKENGFIFINNIIGQQVGKINIPSNSLSIRYPTEMLPDGLYECSFYSEDHLRGHDKLLIMK